MSIAENKLNMEGYLVGYGIIHKDGTEEYHTLEKPIHNKIVKSGINQLLMYNWQTQGGYYAVNNDANWNDYSERENFLYPVFYGVLNNHYGCLHFCRRGTNGDVTNFLDEDLKSPVGNYTSTLKTSSPYTVTKAVKLNEYTITISHIHEAETQPITIQEIGYFGRSGTNNENYAYHMFSRIVLDQPVKLDEGEQLITSYCLTCTVSDEVQHIEDFGGLSGIYADTKYCPYLVTVGNNGTIENNRTIANPRFPFPGVYQSGAVYYPYRHYKRNDRDEAPGRAFLFPQVYLYTNISNFQNTRENIVFGTDSTKQFPDYNNHDDSTVKSTQQATPNSTYEFIDYDPNTNYRDIKLIMPVWNPDLTLDGTSAIDMYYIRARGMDYRLGHTVTTETSTEWVPTPIRKLVNHKMTFTVRTTITTEDTDAWQNGTLTP